MSAPHFFLGIYPKGAREDADLWGSLIISRLSLAYKFTHRKKFWRFLIIAILCLFFRPTSASAQFVSLGTDILQWANFGTANIELNVATSRYFSVNVGARYNPWDFHTKNSILIQNQQLTAYLSCRYWPWYVFSGFFLQAKVQYSDVLRTGVWRPALEDAKKVGLGLSAGYAMMLTTKLNMEFAAGFWGGRNIEYTLYKCPVCMDVRKNGPCNFIELDYVSVTLAYLF